MKTTWLFFLLAFLIGCTSSLPARDEYAIIEEDFVITGNSFILNAEIDVGEVDIKKNNKIDQCHVYIKYNPEQIKSDIRFNEKNNELDIIVDYENWKKWRDDDEENNSIKVKIELPSEPELDLTTIFKAGEFKLELGDLKLRNFNFKNWAGEAKINFDSPNRIKMKELDIDFKIGELEINNLGNARFEEADINSGIGELTVDFNGQAMEKAMARLDLNIGETRVILPNDIGTKLRVTKFLFLSEISYPHWFEKRGSYYYSENYDKSDKLLYLMISTGIGELSIKVE